MATIKQGSTGSNVAELQKKLNSLGYGLSEDGIYGSKTAAAVADYQSKNGLAVDGIVGSQTTASLYGSGSSSSSSSDSDYGPGTTSTTTRSSSKKTYSPYYEVEDYTPSARVKDYADRLSEYEDDYEPYVQSQKVTDYENKTKEYEDDYKPYTQSQKVTDYENKAKEYEADYKPYTQSQKVTDYENKVKEYEDSEPGDFTSRYDATINEILNTINNKGSFDLSSDANYQQLYDNYKERYTNSAKKAMRDTLASVNAATGGYGSTYGQVAAQQAYDSQMEGLNDQNLALMQMAYQMYGDDVANDYNKLSAYQGQDAVDYNRYRDDYNDWYNNRSYYANQYQNAYNNDYGQYRDSANDYYNARSYFANMYQNAYNNDYGQYRDSANDYYNSRSYFANMYQNAYNNDYNQYRDSANDYYNTRNYLANMYQNAYTNDYNEYRNSISDARNEYEDMESTYANAMSYASQGYELPSYLKEQLGDDDLAYFDNVTAQAQQAAASKGSNSGGPSSDSGSGYNTVLADAMKQPTLNDAKACIEAAVDDEKISPEEADDMWLAIENTASGNGTGNNVTDISGYPTPKNYSEYVAYTGDNSVLTQKEFNDRKQGESAGYDSYTDYLAYRWEQFKRSYGISIK